MEIRQGDGFVLRYIGYGFLGIIKAQCKEKFRAFSYLAAHFQGTAHHLHQAAGNGQSKAGSPIAGRCSCLRLFEGVKDTVQG